MIPSEKSGEKVTVYTMSYCPFCTRAKQLLILRGILFREILVPEDDDSQWESLFQRSGLRTMPQIFFEDQLIGGYTDLVELDHQDKLSSLK